VRSASSVAGIIPDTAFTELLAIVQQDVRGLIIVIIITTTITTTATISITATIATIATIVAIVVTTPVATTDFYFYPHSRHAMVLDLVEQKEAHYTFNFCIDLNTNKTPVSEHIGTKLRQLDSTSSIDSSKSAS
jgi:hypothetical protein